MQLFIRFLLITIALLYSAASFARGNSTFYVFADALYWKATENILWAYRNSNSTPNQQIAYQSGDFDFAPGFRVGMGYGNDWDTGIYYTRYVTDTKDSTTGNLKSGFMGGTLGLVGVSDFYSAGQFKMTIDFNMIDWYLGKRFEITPALSLRPSIGLTGGWIDQNIKASFQGVYTTVERIENNFWGIGPKFGIDGNIIFLKKSAVTASFLAEFSAAYLFGRWTMTDVYKDSSPRTIDVDLADRQGGTPVIQGKVGVQFDFDRFTMSLSYEMSDWFDQLQIFDDATGGHDSDLALQGLTLRVAY